MSARAADTHAASLRQQHLRRVATVRVCACLFHLGLGLDMSVVLRSLGSGLANKDVTVATRNGLILNGTLLQLDDETGNVVLHLDARQEHPLPPHLLAVDRLVIRGSAVAYVDFAAQTMNLTLLSRDSLSA